MSGAVGPVPVHWRQPLETHTLEANTCAMVGKRVKQIRKQGQLPAILYGSGIEPVPIALDARETARMMGGITGSTSHRSERWR